MENNYLNSALEKLNNNGLVPLKLHNLPNDTNSSLWNEIRNTYGLNLGELIAIKNTLFEEKKGI